MLSSSRAATRQALRAASGLTAGAHAVRSAVVPSTCSASQVASTSRTPAYSGATGQAFHSSSSRRNVAVAADGRRDLPVPEFNVRMTPEAAKDVNSIQQWLRSAFPNFPFPDDVALQLITHESWDHGLSAGHNRRLAFLGRRALKFYMSLFLAQNSGNEPLQTTEKVNDLVHTSMLGDHVGRELKLGEVMRWTPAVNDGQAGAKETGLFKIRGVVVEALVGAIYHQHGAQAARSFFASRILPNLATFPEQDAERLKDAIAMERKHGEAFLLTQTAANGDNAATETREAGFASSLSSVPSEDDNPSSTSIPSQATTRQTRRRSSTNNAGGAALGLEEDRAARRIDGQHTAPGL